MRGGSFFHLVEFELKERGETILGGKGGSRLNSPVDDAAVRDNYFLPR
jgi:hypothetical protein